MTEENPNHHSPVVVLAPATTTPGVPGAPAASGHPAARPGGDGPGGEPPPGSGGPGGAGGAGGGPGAAAGPPPVEVIRAAWQYRLWAALRHRPLPALVVGILLAVTLGAAGATAELRQRTTYSSTTVMLIDDPLQLATAGDAGQLSKLSSLRVKYTALVGTDAIAQPVAQQVGVPVSTVLADVTATVPLQSLLIDVIATADTPQLAQDLSSTTARDLTYYVVAEDERYSIPDNDRFTLTTIDPATPAAPSQRPTAHAVALGAGLGLVGLVVGFGGVQLVRNRRFLR